MSVTLDAADFTLPGIPEDGGLDYFLTRYRVRQSDNLNRDSSSTKKTVSIFFIHGMSYHKEAWLPTIEHLFELQASSPIVHNSFVVEAWVMDIPNHGRAAIHNDERLLLRPQSVTPEELGRGIQTFLKSGLIAGTSVISVAHSASIVALMLSTTGYPLDNLPYLSMILVEPPYITRELHVELEKDGFKFSPIERLRKVARSRKDIWPSREKAREWMQSRPPWNTWKPRFLDLFIEYGLRDLPTARYPDRTDGVTLCCMREQEAAEYMHSPFESLDRLGEVSSAIPVHCIYGENANVFPDFVRAAFLAARQTQKLASVTTIPDAGHLVVSEDPERLAVAIWDPICGRRQQRVQGRL